MCFLVYNENTILLDRLYNENVFPVLLYVLAYISYKILQAQPPLKILIFVLFI